MQDAGQSSAEKALSEGVQHIIRVWNSAGVALELRSVCETALSLPREERSDAQRAALHTGLTIVQSVVRRTQQKDGEQKDGNDHSEGQLAKLQADVAKEAAWHEVLLADAAHGEEVLTRLRRHEEHLAELSEGLRARSGAGCAAGRTCRWHSRPWPCGNSRGDVEE